MSDTPKTDQRIITVWGTGGSRGERMVPVEFACQLERELVIAEARVKELEIERDILLKLLDSAIGDGPDCDCPPEGHVCGWPKWKAKAAEILNAERERVLRGEVDR